MTTTEFIQFLLERFQIEWKRRDRSGIYGLTQRLLAYNSNKIEGSTLTEEQTASLFDTGTLPKSDDYYRAKDVEETLLKVKPASPEFGGKLGYVNRRWYRNEGFKNQMDYAAQVSRCVMGFMIEKAQAVENIEEICSVPGVDFIQFGPADFSMNSGFNAKEDKERVRRAEEKVIETALRCHVNPRVEINTAKEAKRYMEMGVRHFALGSELRMAKTFWTEEGNEIRSIIKN